MWFPFSRCQTQGTRRTCNTLRRLLPSCKLSPLVISSHQYRIAGSPTSWWHWHSWSRRACHPRPPLLQKFHHSRLWPPEFWSFSYDENGFCGCACNRSQGLWQTTERSCSVAPPQGYPGQQRWHKDHIPTQYCWRKSPTNLWRYPRWLHCGVLDRLFLLGLKSLEPIRSCREPLFKVAINTPLHVAREALPFLWLKWGFFP